MPKKTKREKILAEYRKKLKQLQLAKPIITDTNTNRTETLNEPPLQKPSPPARVPLKKIPVYQEKEYDKLLTQFTIQDLKKTFFISLFILTLEFFIFYVNLKGISFVK